MSRGICDGMHACIACMPSRRCVLLLCERKIPFMTPRDGPKTGKAWRVQSSRWFIRGTSFTAETEVLQPDIHLHQRLGSLWYCTLYLFAKGFTVSLLQLAVLLPYLNIPPLIFSLFNISGLPSLFSPIVDRCVIRATHPPRCFIKSY